MKNTIKKVLTAMTLIVAIASISPSNKIVKAEEAVNSYEIEAKIEETRQTKRLGHYNEAYAMIIRLPKGEQTKYLDELTKLSDYVYTPLNKEIINEIKVFSEDPNLRNYDALVAEIEKKVSDTIDRAYFLGEMAGWGRKIVYTPEVLASVDAVIKVYSQKTIQSVNTSKAAIAKVKNVDSREYLKEQLIDAASKVDGVLLVYFD